RFFLSDVINQQLLVQNTAIGRIDGTAAVSIVGQPPAGGAKIAMLAYHLASDSPLGKRRLSKHDLLVEHRRSRHLWSTQLCAGTRDHLVAPAAQTRRIFGELVQSLDRAGASLNEHCVRTWIYLKDVDVFYQGMVDERRSLFEAQGLTADTHYIASTGI